MLNLQNIVYISNVLEYLNYNIDALGYRKLMKNPYMYMIETSGILLDTYLYVKTVLTLSITAFLSVTE